MVSALACGNKWIQVGTYSPVVAGATTLAGREGLLSEAATSSESSKRWLTIAGQLEIAAGRLVVKVGQLVPGGRKIPALDETLEGQSVTSST